MLDPTGGEEGLTPYFLEVISLGYRIPAIAVPLSYSRPSLAVPASRPQDKLAIMDSPTAGLWPMIGITFKLKFQTEFQCS